MHFFLQELVNGLTQGSVFALIALGYSMVYGVLKLLNFAHGDLYMVGAFIGYFVIQWFGGSKALSLPVPIVLLVMFLLAGGGVGMLGVVIERFAYRPLRDAPRIAPLITALGVVLMIGLRLLVNRTKLGRQMRAVAADREAAEMLGIDVDFTIEATFFLGSALAGISGVMAGLVYNSVWNYMGFTAGLNAFTAAVVGGIGSLPGAVLGGLLIGLAQSFIPGYVSSLYTNLIVFGILIAVMLLRPSGLLGRVQLQKV